MNPENSLIKWDSYSDDKQVFVLFWLWWKNQSQISLWGKYTLSASWLKGGFFLMIAWITWNYYKLSYFFQDATELFCIFEWLCLSSLIFFPLIFVWALECLSGGVFWSVSLERPRNPAPCVFLSNAAAQRAPHCLFSCHWSTRVQIHEIIYLQESHFR